MNSSVALASPSEREMSFTLQMIKEMVLLQLEPIFMDGFQGTVHHVNYWDQLVLTVL